MEEVSTLKFSVFINFDQTLSFGGWVEFLTFVSNVHPWPRYARLWTRVILSRPEGIKMRESEQNLVTWLEDRLPQSFQAWIWDPGQAASWGELSKLVTSLEPPSTEPGREDTEHGSLDMCRCCGIYGNTWNCNQFNVNFTCQSQTPVYICTAPFLVSTSFMFVCLVGWLI